MKKIENVLCGSFKGPFVSGISNKVVIDKESSVFRVGVNKLTRESSRVERRSSRKRVVYPAVWLTSAQIQLCGDKRRMERDAGANANRML